MFQTHRLMTGKQLTLAQAAQIAKRDPSTLRHAIKDGALKATKFGKTWVVTEGDLDVWISADIHKRGPKKRMNTS